MLRVSLSGLRFHAPIGLYPQELLLNNEIEINLSVWSSAELENLPFIDYEKLYALVEQEVKLPESLLERLLVRIVTVIRQVFPETEIEVTIRKFHPPFGGHAAYAEIKWDPLDK
jgi:dihydroneopterin aldolase